MESSPGLLNSLAPPALMVLTSATESANGSASLCQQAPGFAVPVTMEKGQVPFLGPSYTLAPVFHQGDSSGVEYPPPLLHLHPQFGVLGYRPLHPYSPFQEVECFRQAYLAGSKSLKQLPSAEPPQLRYLASERDFKKYRGQPPAGPAVAAATGKRNPAGTPGMTASSETLWKSSQHGRSKGSKLAQDCCVFLRCPLCQEELKRGDVQQHLQQELERLSALQPSCEKELLYENTSQQLASSPPVKEEVDSPSGSPLSIDGGHHLERQQTFQQVRINRESRRNARAKRCKRPRPSDEEQVAGPRFPDTEEDGFPGNQHVEYSWQSAERSSAQAFPGLRGSSSHLAPGPTSRDSEGDVDTDGDEPPLLSKLKCPTVGRVEGQAHKLMEAQDKDSPTLRTASSDEDEGVTSEILKARISELTHRLLRRESYRCHVCMASYSVPLASIQCWHIHCEECWLRTLGSKKLCPQCNAITSPHDLRRIYL